MDELGVHARGIALTVLESLAPADVGAAVTVTSGEPLACAVRIEGDWRGRVIVTLSPRLAASIATRMFALSTISTDDVREAVREVSNIVAGNLKPLLGGTRNTLGLPEDLSHRDKIGPSIAHVVVLHRGEPLEIHVQPSVEGAGDGERNLG